MAGVDPNEEQNGGSGKERGRAGGTDRLLNARPLTEIVTFL